MREAEKFGAVARVLAEVAPTLPVGDVLAKAEEVVRLFRRDRTVLKTRRVPRVAAGTTTAGRVEVGTSVVTTNESQPELLP